MYHDDHTTGVLGNNGSRMKSYFTFACRQTHLMVNYAINKNYRYLFMNCFNFKG